MTAVDIDATIPNNVDLADDRRLQRALESWQPAVHRVVARARPGRLPGQRRVPPHRDRRRPGGLGQLRPRQDARLPLGDLPRRARARPHASRSAITWASRSGRRCPASTAPTCAGCSSCRATPSRRRSSSSGSCASPRRASTTCATCSRSTSRRAATSGRWCTCCTATSAATGATRPTRCSSATPATPTTRASSARSTSRRPTGCRSSSSRTSPTATASSSSPRCARAAFDPLSRTCDFMLKEEAHHMFVGATGIGRVVQRTVELMKEHDTDDVRPVRRHRRGDAAALPQLPLLACRSTCSVPRRRPTPPTTSRAGLKGRFQEERRDDDHRLHDATRIVPARRRRGRSATREVARARGAQRDAARRLRRRLPEGRRPLEPHARRGRRASCGCRTSGSTAPSATFAGQPVARTGASSATTSGVDRRRRLAADGERPRPTSSR